MIDSDKNVIKRKSQNISDVITKVGGFYEGLVVILGVLLAPFSAHFFVSDLVSDSLMDPSKSSK